MFSALTGHWEHMLKSFLLFSGERGEISILAHEQARTPQSVRASSTAINATRRDSSAVHGQ